MGKRIVEIRDMKTLKRSFPSRRNYLLTALFICIALISVAYLYFSDRDDGDFFHASIDKAEGAVTVLSIDSDEAVNAEEGMVLREGDRIITGFESVADVSFMDGSCVRLSSESSLFVKSLFAVDEGSGVVVMNLSEGRLWGNVVDLEESFSRFEINSPSAVLGIRGTLFSLEVDNNKDSVARVYSGLVGVFAASEENGMVFSPQDGELVLDDMSQVDLLYDEPLPLEAEDLDPLGVDDFDKDCLVDDSPVLYVDVDLQANAMLARITEQKLNEILAELDVLYNELDFVVEKLSGAVSEADREGLQTAKTLLETEIEENLRLFELIEEEYEFIVDQKVALEKIASRIDEESDSLDKDDFINEIRLAALDIRSAHKEPQRIGREQEIYERDSAIKSLRKELVSNLRELGLAEEVEDLRETIFLSLRQYSYPEQTASEVAGRYEETVSERDYSPAPPYTEPAREVTPTPAPSPEPEIEDEETVDKEPEYEVLLKQYPDTGGSLSGGGFYSKDSEAELSAVPAEGYAFVGWEYDGDIVSTDESYSITVADDISLKALFKLREYLVLFADHLNSELYLELVKHGSDATPPEIAGKEGYIFTGWDVDYTSVVKDLAITAEYKKKDFLLKYNSSDNGSIKGEAEQRVLYGEDGSMVEAVPDGGFYFAGWSDGLDLAKRYEAGVKKDIVLTANFEPIEVESDEQDNVENNDKDEESGDEEASKEENNDSDDNDDFIGPVKYEDSKDKNTSDNEGETISNEMLNDKESKDSPDDDVKDGLNSSEENSKEGSESDGSPVGDKEQGDVADECGDICNETVEDFESVTPEEDILSSDNSESEIKDVNIKNDDEKGASDSFDVQEQDLQESDMQEEPLQSAQDDDSSTSSGEEVTDGS